MFSGVTNFFGAVSEKAKSTTNSLVSKVSELHLSEKLNNANAYVYNLGESVVHKGKELTGSLVEKSKEVGNSIVEKGKEINNSIYSTSNQVLVYFSF